MANLFVAGITGLFYLFFWTGVTILFATCMKLWMGTLSEDYPKWQMDESLIGTNPGEIFYIQIYLKIV